MAKEEGGFQLPKKSFDTSMQTQQQFWQQLP